MEYITNIKKLCDYVTSPNLECAQITIDFFQDFEEDFFTDRDWNENPIERDELGAVQYDIQNLLEVMDRKFKNDIDVFQKMYKWLGDWAKDIEDRNIILGIPKHKG